LSVSIVVPVNTTDDQLRSLLWLFREKVRSRQFADLGLKSTEWESSNSGVVEFYRGAKCANEDYVVKGPCGQGSHTAAYYHWGLESDPSKDAGYLQQKNEDETLVFDFKDGWTISPEAQAKMVAKDKADDAEREAFAKLLQDELTGMGLEMSVRPSLDPKNQLHIDSDIFKDTPTRVQFVTTVLPSSKAALCKVGYRSVRLTKGGFFEEGQAYSLGCK